MTSSTATIALRWVSSWRGRRPRMSRTLKVWVRSAVSVTALFLFAAQAEAACVFYWMLRSGPGAEPSKYYVCTTIAEAPTGVDGYLAYDLTSDTLHVWDVSSWVAVGGGGGGAPTTAQYWVGAADGSLSAEKDLSALATGLVINTGGTPSAYTGTSCINQFTRSLSAVGAATCSSVSLTADVAGDLPLSSLAPSGAASKLLGRGSTGAGDFQEITLGTNLSMSGATLNAAGGGGSIPTGTGFRHVTGGVEDAAAALVDLGTDITATTLPLAKLTDDASSGLCLLSGGAGNPAWTTCPGGGGGASLLRVTANVPNTTTTFADVTGLTKALSASTVYYFRCSLAYTSAATTTAVQVSINGPTSPTAMQYEVEVSTTATARHNSSQSAYDTVVNPGTGGGATALPVMLSGVLENGANTGTFAVRFRSEVASSAVTVLRGSWCVVF